MLNNISKPKKKHKRALPIETLNEVLNCYQAEENSIQIPVKKYVSKKTMKPTLTLNKTTRALHKKYISEKGRKVELRKFQQLRPKNVKLVKQSTWNQCVCLDCENVRLMLQSLNKFTYEKYDLFTWLNNTLCQVKEKYHDTVCTERLCKKCGVDS